MKTAVYMHELIYRYGGAEGYTATLIEILQNIFKESFITIITESYNRENNISKAQFIDNLNKAYGLNINPNYIKILYIPELKDNYIKIKKRNKIIQLIQFLYAQKLFFKKQQYIAKSTKGFDLFINCSRELFYGKARKNISIIHLPYEKIISAPINKKIPWLKKKADQHDINFVENTDLFIPNSNFTSYWLTKEWQVPENKKVVLYPPVTEIESKAKKHTNQIFICSRIESTKKIDLLINAYESSEVLKNNCRLVIAGSIKEEDISYIEYIKNISPAVEFHFNPSRKEIEKLYAESDFFWHARGLDEIDPRLFEHFGITTVEAMSAGCIPIVINKGGQQEIVNKDCGFKFNTLAELVFYTEKIIKNPDEMIKLRKNAIKQSKKFSKNMFKINFEKILCNTLKIILNLS